MSLKKNPEQLRAVGQGLAINDKWPTLQGSRRRLRDGVMQAIAERFP
jgi:hypothetical protein